MAAVLQLEHLHRPGRPKQEPWNCSQPVAMVPEAQLPRRLHPFGHHVQVQALRQRQNGAHDGRIVRVGQHVAHKAPVDLDLVER